MKNYYFTLKGLFKFLAVIFIVVCLSGCAAGLRKEVAGSNSGYKLIIDAGSSGSRIYVYKVIPDKVDTLPAVEFIDTDKVEPGISEYLEKESEVKEGLLKLIDFAKETIGEEFSEGIPLYVLATAGMRLEDKNTQNKIIAKIRELYKGIPFELKSVKVISGKMEGLYSWLAVNYLDDGFDPDLEREGMIEMGGASTQITFIPANKKEFPCMEREIRGKDYSIFSKSYLYLGQDQAKKLTNEEDCHTSCYPVNCPVEEGRGTGNFNDCKKCIHNRMSKLCRDKGFGCIFEREELPDKSLDEFIACSAFYYTFSFPGFGLNLDKINLEKLKTKGIVLCSKEWEDLKKEYPDSQEKYLSGFCFNSAYFWSLLTNGYNFDDYASSPFISTKDKIGKDEISWTLGTVIDIELGYNP